VAARAVSGLSRYTVGPAPRTALRGIQARQSAYNRGGSALSDTTGALCLAGLHTFSPFFLLILKEFKDL
jgi:hypothetical protein